MESMLICIRLREDDYKIINNSEESNIKELYNIFEKLQRYYINSNDKDDYIKKVINKCTIYNKQGLNVYRSPLEYRGSKDKYTSTTCSFRIEEIYKDISNIELRKLFLICLDIYLNSVKIDKNINSLINELEYILLSQDTEKDNKGEIQLDKIIVYKSRGNYTLVEYGRDLIKNDLLTPDNVIKSVISIDRIYKLINLSNDDTIRRIEKKWSEIGISISRIDKITPKLQNVVERIYSTSYISMSEHSMLKYETDLFKFISDLFDIEEKINPKNATIELSVNENEKADIEAAILLLNRCTSLRINGVKVDTSSIKINAV